MSGNGVEGRIEWERGSKVGLNGSGVGGGIEW